MYVNFLVHIIGDHADDANILGRSVHSVKKNTEASIVASKEIGLEVNAKKTMYMVMSRDQNHEVTVQRLIIVAEWVEQFGYLGTALTYQNSIQEENKCRLKSQNAC